jgi:hypothetical protein
VKGTVISLVLLYSLFSLGYTDLKLRLMFLEFVVVFTRSSNLRIKDITDPKCRAEYRIVKITETLIVKIVMLVRTRI